MTTKAYKLKVESGNHHRINCPVWLSIRQEEIGENIEELRLVDQEGNDLAIQWRKVEDHYQIVFMIGDMPKNEIHTYQLFINDGVTRPKLAMDLQQSEFKVDVLHRGNVFTSYVHDPSLAKPYLGPILDSRGLSYTRMDLEAKEHPHHRSLWIGIGDVNGVDLWNEPEGQYGKQIHQKFNTLEAGAVYAEISADHVWTNYKGKPLVDEKRRFVFYNTTEGSRLIDVDITFTANYGQCEFGATKEAGPLGIRVAESMNVDQGEGMITNAYGSISERECWGKRAAWCNYYGAVKGRQLGIAVFDHSENEHYPSHWHVRNYGLLAPNNFYFAGGKLIKPNETLRFRYRLYFHETDELNVQVGERYQDFMHPPQVKLKV